TSSAAPSGTNPPAPQARRAPSSNVTVVDPSVLRNPPLPVHRHSPAPSPSVAFSGPDQPKDIVACASSRPANTTFVFGDSAPALAMCSRPERSVVAPLYVFVPDRVGPNPSDVSSVRPNVCGPL